MVQLPEPRAARLRRPSWRDPRLLVGMILVLASVAVGARVVAAADDTEPVWAAAGALPPGRVLAPSDLRVVQVRLGSGSARYVGAGERLPGDAVLLRGLEEGELLPAAAVGRSQDWRLRPVTVPQTGPPPEGLRVGGRVDVWSSAKDTGGPGGGGTTYRPPVLLAPAAAVSAVSVPRGGLGGGQGGAVQVLLDEAGVRNALDALANGARIALVPAPGPAEAVGDPGAGQGR